MKTKVSADGKQNTVYCKGTEMERERITPALANSGEGRFSSNVRSIIINLIAAP